MSRDLFSNRVAYLAARDSKEGVADYYGVSTETVSRWIRGTQKPRDQSVRSSIVSRGLKIAGKSGYVDTPQGRLKVIDGATLKAVRTINRERELLKQQAINAATNDRQREIARRQYGPLTQNEILDLQRKMQNYQENRALNKPEKSESAGQEIRQEYNRLMKRQQVEQQQQPEETVQEPIRRRVKRESYTILKRGSRRKVYVGTRGGFYYKEPSGRRVYVPSDRVRGVRYAGSEN